MKVTLIPVIIGVPGTIHRGLENGLEVLEIKGREETIQTTTLLKLARILRSVLELLGDLQSLRLHWKSINKRWREKLTWSKILVVIILKVTIKTGNIRSGPHQMNKYKGKIRK